MQIITIHFYSSSNVFFLISCPWLVLKFVLKRYLDIGEKVIIVVSYHSLWFPNTENKAM